MEWITPHTIYVILHLIGVAVGAGAAFMSDVLFLNAARDRQCGPIELRILRVASRVVWLGTGILVLSGALLFFEDPERYMASTKFLAKMTIVGIIIVNGLVFKHTHMPLMERTSTKRFFESPEFLRGSTALFASGAISVTSWISAIVLGALRGIPYPYTTIMSWYVALLGVALVGAMVIRRSMIRP